MAPFDPFWFHAINAAPGTDAWMITTALFISQTTPGWVMACVLIGLVKPSTRTRAALLLSSIAMAWCAVHLVHWIMPVQRPAALGLGTQWLSQGERPGFPSMHATTSAALAAALWLQRSTWAWAATLFALVLGLSRVFLGVHFPSDILGAFVVGPLAALATQALTRGLHRLGDAALNVMNPQWHLEPSASRTGNTARRE